MELNQNEIDKIKNVIGFMIHELFEWNPNSEAVEEVMGTSIYKKLFNGGGLTDGDKREKEGIQGKVF